MMANLKNDGDDRWLVEERQRGQRKPNEDAESVLARDPRKCGRFRDQITRQCKFGRDRTQNRFPLLLIAPMGLNGRLRE
jgi:hypothetical protein